MLIAKGVPVSSCIGQRETDCSGSPVSVLRLDPSRAYAGTGELLESYINTSNEDAWRRICAKIDFIYQHFDTVLAALDGETDFGAQVAARVAAGQKLLFKPNLVDVFDAIDPQSHGPGKGSTTCTEWPFVAALMRWFHDKLGISYHQMCVGEASTTASAAANLFSLLNPERQPITTEAVMEGRAGDFYGGWGFYFARLYLSQTHDRSHLDDPMRGYEESVAGKYLSPGSAPDKLMVYDLNRLYDDPGKARDLAVPGWTVFPSITLHKVIAGGNPDDPADRAAYPGCVLINVPKLKVHSVTLLTNAIKNLGIGLYPMQAPEPGTTSWWKYAVPHSMIPGLKGGLPHSNWVADRPDPETGMPRRDGNGRYIVKRSGGLGGVMLDVLAAVRREDIFTLHIVDGIEAINLDHTGNLPGTKHPEGLVFASLDPVALDLACARYLFTNVPMDEAPWVDVEDGAGGRFLQKVPAPEVEGGNIVTHGGYDCPLRRDAVLHNAELRGLGVRKYHVIGRDVIEDCPMVSIAGHLGRIQGGNFRELITSTLYFDVFKMPWDLQLTAFGYFDAVDRLTGSSLLQDFREAFDEDGDGVVGYEEFSKNGLVTFMMSLAGATVVRTGAEKFGIHPANFAGMANQLKLSNPKWNPGGHDLLERAQLGSICMAAYRMSQLDFEARDPFQPALSWGKGKWPSFPFASFILTGSYLYGGHYPAGIGFPSLYAHALYYADLKHGDGRYAGRLILQPDAAGAQKYVRDVLAGSAEPLDFVLYVPRGYGSLDGVKVPNVVETDDPALVFIATFAGGAERWPMEWLQPAEEPHLALAV